MKKINYKSDFDFIAKLTATNANGESVEVGFPDYDFELIITSGCNGYSTRSFVASSIAGVTKNCFNDNGQLHIVCDNHKLNVGELFGEFKAYLPNDIYPDGTQLNVEPQSLGIELVVGASDTPTTAEIEFVLPYIYQSAYDLAVASGYEGSLEDYLRLSAELPEAIETAKLVKLSADSLANSASSLSESATKVSEAANTIKESATTLENSATSINASAESLSQSASALDLLSSEFADGRKAIATALTNRRYPTEPTESFHAMADKITNMSYDEGWFAKIGYTEENSLVKEMVDYAYNLAKGWNPDGSTMQMFKENRSLVFLPMIDTSNVTNMSQMFNGCSSLTTIPLIDTSNVVYMDSMFYGCRALTTIPQLDTSNVVTVHNVFQNCSALTTIPLLDTSSVTTMTSMFYGCSALTTIPLIDTSSVSNINYMFQGCSALSTIPRLDTSNVVNMDSMFNGCSALTTIPQLDTSNVVNMSNVFSGCNVLRFIKITNLGKSKLATYDFSGASVWGTGSEENRQSLIDSLITYSYDRASNGMATATIKLSATTKALLTEEEIAQITNKGFTIS